MTYNIDIKRPEIKHIVTTFKTMEVTQSEEIGNQSARLLGPVHRTGGVNTHGNRIFNK